MKDGSIQDSQLSVSSDAGGSYAATEGRLDRTVRGWAAGSNNQEQWIQADLLDTTFITGVITQGRYDGGQWVTAFRVLYSNDESTWSEVLDSSGNIKVGNNLWYCEIEFVRYYIYQRRDHS